MRSNNFSADRNQRESCQRTDGSGLQPVSQLVCLRWLDWFTGFHWCAAYSHIPASGQNSARTQRPAGSASEDEQRIGRSVDSDQISRGRRKEFGFGSSGIDVGRWREIAIADVGGRGCYTSIGGQDRRAEWREKGNRQRNSAWPEIAVMPLQFEHRWLRTFFVFLMLAVFGLQIWYLFIDQPARFSALSAANVFTIKEIVQFEREVQKFKADNDYRFDEDEIKRRANMGSWVAQATKTTQIVQQLQKDLEQFKGELRFTVSTTEDYGWLTKLTVYNIERQVNEILRQVQANRTSIQIAGEHADQLRKQAAVLQKQNKELRRKKAKPIFKLFLHQPTKK
jgi:hypothetical protein